MLIGKVIMVVDRKRPKLFLSLYRYRRKINNAYQRKVCLAIIQIIRTRQRRVTFILFFSFFSYLGFLSRPFTNHRTAGEGEGNSLTPHYHFRPLHRHLDISRAITVGSSPLRIASSRTRTGNISSTKSVESNLIG